MLRLHQKPLILRCVAVPSAIIRPGAPHSSAIRVLLNGWIQKAFISFSGVLHSWQEDTGDPLSDLNVSF